MSTSAPYSYQPITKNTNDKFGISLVEKKSQQVFEATKNLFKNICENDVIVEPNDIMMKEIGHIYTGEENLSDPYGLRKEFSSMDIRNITKKIETSKPGQLMTESFRIDNEKMNQLMNTECLISGINSIEHFFSNVMKLTRTYVKCYYPKSYDYKPSTNPMVTIFGAPEDVFEAKYLIKSQLCVDKPETNQIVNMELDIPTAQPGIIKSHTHNARKFVNQTSTAVAFPAPDEVDACNRVFIPAPDVQHLENTRKHFQSLKSFCVNFWVQTHSPLLFETLCARTVEELYNVRVSKTLGGLIEVHGSNVDALKKATKCLLRFAFGNRSTTTPLSINFHISPKNIGFVKGGHNWKVMRIMKKTGACIKFSSQYAEKRSLVQIYGVCSNVFATLTEFLGLLPVAVTFEWINIDREDYKLGLQVIGDRHKVVMKRTVKSFKMEVTVLGMEADIQSIYIAYEEAFDFTMKMTQ